MPVVPEESARGVLNVGLVHDRIASLDGLGLMSADFHGHRAGHPGPFSIADCTATEVVTQHAHQPHVLTGM